MTNNYHASQTNFTLSKSQPLIGIPATEKGHLVVRYFADETQAQLHVSSEIRQQGESLAGAWSKLPSEYMEEKLDAIRHESTPTPPIEL